MTSVDELLSDIDLGALAPARGAAWRKKIPISYVYLRDLNERDFELLKNPPTLGVTTEHLQRITARHHSLARLLAEGRSAVECSAITGHSQSRISILQDDPAFAELIEFYKSQVREVYLNVHERLAALGISCLEELQARVEENPSEFTPRELREIMATAFDKSVAPDKSPKGGIPGPLGGGGLSIAINFPPAPNADTPQMVRPAAATLELSAEESDDL